MRKPIILIITAMAFLAGGCSEKSVTPQADVSSVTNSGAIPESVQKLLVDHSLPAEGPIYDVTFSEIGNDPPSLTDTSYDVFSVTLIWGSLPGVSITSSVTTDWTGSLAVNAEAIVSVVHTIDFEPGQDSLVETNIPSMAAWVSATTGEFDGLSTAVFLKRGNVYITPPVLTFDTQPVTLQFDFNRLVKLEAIYRIDEYNFVAILARQIWPNVCERGTVDGDWVKHGSFSQEGYFSGIWRDFTGNPIGCLAGNYWTDSEGQRLLHGWLSGYITTQIIAELYGTWYYDDPRMCPVCGEGHGRFMAKIVYQDGETGYLTGEFGDYSIPPADSVMPFHGKWQKNCLVVRDGISISGH